MRRSSAPSWTTSRVRRSAGGRSSFTGGRDGTLTYDRLLVDLFTQRGAAMAPALELAVERLHALAGESPCRAW